MTRRKLLPVLVFAACSGRGSAPTTPPLGAGSAEPTAEPVVTRPVDLPPAGNTIKVTLADVGLEPGSLDRTAEPCTDFYQFACGGWIASNPIPPDRARWARFSELDEKNLAALQTTLERAAASPGSNATAKKLGDYYASCMDTAGIERAGLAPIQPVLTKVAKVRDAKSFLATVAALHGLGIDVVWNQYVAADMKDSTTNVTYLDAGGLGLPDRDYYLTKELAEKRTAYEAHVGKLLVLAGIPAARADAAAKDILAIETELAKLHKTATEARDSDAAYNPTDVKALAQRARSVDWTAYWKALGATPSKKLIVPTPKFFDGLDAVRKRFTPAQWSSYFTYHLVSSLAIALPKAVDDEVFELAKALTGVEQQRDRSKRCIEATQGALGELLGELYVAEQFPPESKQSADALVGAIMKVMGEQIAALDWMSPATKQTAAGKLAKLVRMVGYPEKWRTYAFDVKRADFAGNAMRARAFEVKRVLAKAGKPYDRTEWFMNAYDVNAYYDPSANNTALPAGILQPPFFGQKRGVAVNLGGIGMVIGHELTHGFDDQGAKFDADGNLQDWWQKQDLERFTEKSQCVADQYATFEAMPKGFINGKLTLGENIADLGGTKMAFHAYRMLRQGAAEAYVADGFTEDQQFFIAVAQAWCSHDRPAEIQRRLTVDPHSPPKFRVYGSLRNMKEFAEAFRCAPGTPMNPAKTCSVW